MRFSSLLFGTAALSLVLLSCSKEKTPAPNPVVNPAEKIIAVFKFDGNPADSAGKVVLGSTTGNPVYVVDRKGNLNSALWLNGATKLEYPDAPFKGQSLTMAAWVKAQTSAGLTHFIVALHPDKGGPTLFKIGDKLGGSVSVTSTNSVESNEVNDQWHHLAMTYDGKDIKIYVDGVLASTTNHPGTIGDASRNLVIGAFQTSYWTGTLDDVRIYNAVLSNETISQLASL